MNKDFAIRGAPKMKFWHGLVVGLLACAACATIQNRYYGLAMPEQCYDQSTLLGKEGSANQGWPDLSMTECKPSPQVKGKCVIQLEQDFFNKDRALKQCLQKLEECQKGSPPAFLDSASI